MRIALIGIGGSSTIDSDVSCEYQKGDEERCGTENELPETGQRCAGYPGPTGRGCDSAAGPAGRGEGEQLR